MKKISIYFLLSLFLLAGCSQYKDPELAKKIAQLEAKENLDEFDKEELKDLKEQAKYGTNSIDSCELK